MENLVLKLGDRIRNIRKQQGMSQELLGERSGLHTNYIGQVERGEKNVTVESLERIANGLNISLEQLFRHLDPVPPTDDLHRLLLLLEDRPPQDKQLALQLLQSVFRWGDQKF